MLGHGVNNDLVPPPTSNLPLLFSLPYTEDLYNCVSTLDMEDYDVRSAASILASVKEQEERFEQLTRALEEERRNVTLQLERSAAPPNPPTIQPPAWQQVVMQVNDASIFGRLPVSRHFSTDLCRPSLATAVKRQPSRLPPRPSIRSKIITPSCLLTVIAFLPSVGLNGLSVPSVLFCELVNVFPLSEPTVVDCELIISAVTHLLKRVDEIQPLVLFFFRLILLWHSLPFNPPPSAHWSLILPFGAADGMWHVAQLWPVSVRISAKAPANAGFFCRRRKM